MLSRVAERVYWMSRYLERAENSARLIGVYTGLLLDLPAEAGLGWEVVVDITGTDGAAAPQGGDAPERAILDFLLSSDSNPSSILSCLNQARENARTTRDIVPTEAWRAVNELCLFAREELPGASRARSRAQVMNQLVRGVQQLTGLLSGTMSHGPAYQFIRLGRNLERADMTTRMIDVAAAVLLTGRPELARVDNTLWMAVLRSLSAYQMYRQYVRRRIMGPDVIAFLLLDAEFPRAVRHCLEQSAVALRDLPRQDFAIGRVACCLARLEDLEPAGLDNAAIHALVDELQLDIAHISDAIGQTWFYPDLQPA